MDLSEVPSSLSSLATLTPKEQEFYLSADVLLDCGKLYICHMYLVDMVFMAFRCLLIYIHVTLSYQ